MASPGSIFISYRRSDSIAETGRIYDRLVAAFGRDHVFQDVDSIPLGVDFVEYLDQAVGQCQVVLVIIGKTWLTVAESDGTRRLDNPDDFVRIEVEWALRRGIRVIPVLLPGASMPRRVQLPESLQPLARRNRTEVGHDPRFHADMTRLVKGLKAFLGVSVVPDGQSSVVGLSGVGTSTRDEKIVYVQSGAKYDLRGAQFGGGFAEMVQGDQVGGTINNASSPLTSKTPTFLTEKLAPDITLDMVYIPEGDFLMGSPDGEAERSKDEGPQHRVSVPAFYMGKYAVTQAQWLAVANLDQVDIGLDPDPSRFKGKTLPVEQVSWIEAVEFCQRLFQHTGINYRLPSEAEWEYACRARTVTPFHCGETISSEQANYDGNYTYGEGNTGAYLGKTTPVGSFSANDFGLYDMHGNVYEWCQDDWHDSYQNAPTDGSAWLKKGESKVVRGGAWYFDPRFFRSAYRDYDSPGNRGDYIGFRVSCAAPRILP